MGKISLNRTTAKATSRKTYVHFLGCNLINVCRGCRLVIGKTQWRSFHYSDVIMGTMASQITGVSIFYSSVCSGADHRKHQSSVSLVFLRGIHRWPVNYLHKWPVTRKMFLHLMTSSWFILRGRSSGRTAYFDVERISGLQSSPGKICFLISNSSDSKRYCLLRLVAWVNKLWCCLRVPNFNVWYR